MQVVFKFAHANQNMAYFIRKNFRRKNIAFPLSMFKDGKPPESLTIECPEFAATPRGPNRVSLKKALAGRSKEEKAAIRKKIQEAQRRALEEAGMA